MAFPKPEAEAEAEAEADPAVYVAKSCNGNCGSKVYKTYTTECAKDCNCKSRKGAIVLPIPRRCSNSCSCDNCSSGNSCSCNSCSGDSCSCNDCY